MPILTSPLKAAVVAVPAVVFGVTLLAQGLNLRTGTWEYTMTVAGALPMDGIPENMRASMEAELRKPQTFKSCLTAEDLKTFKLGKNDDSDDEECKVLSSQVGPTGGEVTKACTGDQPHTETVHVDAPSPQSMHAVITRKGAKGDMVTTLNGRWLAAQCKE